MAKTFKVEKENLQPRKSNRKSFYGNEEIIDTNNYSLDDYKKDREEEFRLLYPEAFIDYAYTYES